MHRELGMTTWREVRRATALAGIAVASVATAAGAQENPFRWSGRMASGQVLDVRGISGDIRAELASGSAAEIVAQKRGRSGDFDQVEIRVVEESDGVTVCAVYRPEEHPGGGCDLDEGDRVRRDRSRRDEIRVSVDYVVKVPAGVDLVGSMVSGDVEARGLRSDVKASTVSGDVFVSTTGTARANTVSGSIDVEMGSLDWRDLSFHTVSGDITLRLPASLAADVEFESLSGDLDTDFDLALQGRSQRRWVGERLRGTIGDGGGRSLSLQTVSGDVRLRKAG
jgi:hypothetical protein